MICCWSAQGGVGTTTVVAGICRALASRARVPLAVDLAGDLPATLGADVAGSPGVAEWAAAGPAVAADALDRIAIPAGDLVHLLARGAGPLPRARLEVLAALMAERPDTVVDAGRCPSTQRGDEWPGWPFVAAAERSLVVTRACPVALSHLRAVADVGASGLVVVRSAGRRTPSRLLAGAVGAPLVAEVAMDPMVGAAVDAGMAGAPLPRSFLRALGRLA